MVASVVRSYAVFVEETVDSRWGDEALVFVGAVEARDRFNARREARRQLGIPEDTRVAVVAGGVRVEAIRE